MPNPPNSDTNAQERKRIGANDTFKHKWMRTNWHKKRSMICSSTS